MSPISGMTIMLVVSGSSASLSSCNSANIEVPLVEDEANDEVDDQKLPTGLRDRSNNTHQKRIGPLLLRRIESRKV